MSDEAIKGDFMEIHKGVHDLKHFLSLFMESRGILFSKGYN